MKSKSRVTIIDTEWTPSVTGKPKFELIEFALVNMDYDHEQKRWIQKETYSGLVHTKEKLGQRIKKLTGITQDDVDHAPKFYQRAELIELMTRNRLLVGHAVEQDFEILQSYFKECGIEYHRELYCTLAKTKQDWPELKSYELGQLTVFFGLPPYQSHRALGDAMACAHLFKTLYHPPKAHMTTQKSWDKIFPWLNHPSREQLQELKQTPAIFSVYSHKKLLYIEDLKCAQTQVPKKLEMISKDYQEQIAKRPLTHLRIEYQDHEFLNLTQVERIKLKTKPLLQKNKTSLYGLYSFRTKTGLTEFKVRNYQKGKKNLHSVFQTKAEALKVLYQMRQKLGPDIVLTDSINEHQQAWIQESNKKRKRLLKELDLNTDQIIQLKMEDCISALYIRNGLPHSRLYYQKGRLKWIPLGLVMSTGVKIQKLITKVKGRHKHPYDFIACPEDFKVEHWRPDAQLSACANSAGPKKSPFVADASEQPFAPGTDSPTALEQAAH